MFLSLPYNHTFVYYHFHNERLAVRTCSQFHLVWFAYDILFAECKCEFEHRIYHFYVGFVGYYKFERDNCFYANLGHCPKLDVVSQIRNGKICKKSWWKTVSKLFARNLKKSRNGIKDKKKITFRDAEKKYRISKSTLQRKVNNKNMMKVGRPNTLSEKDEENLVKGICLS
ncbi:DDE-1 domain-containing protein, partial [Aphis craccivora]